MLRFVMILMVFPELLSIVNQFTAEPWKQVADCSVDGEDERCIYLWLFADMICNANVGQTSNVKNTIYNTVSKK